MLAIQSFPSLHQEDKFLLHQGSSLNALYHRISTTFGNWVQWWKSESESHSVVSNSLQAHGLYSPWNSPGQKTRVDSHSLLQGIFPAQGLNPGLLNCRRILYHLSHQGSPGSWGGEFLFISHVGDLGFTQRTDGFFKFHSSAPVTDSRGLVCFSMKAFEGNLYFIYLFRDIVDVQYYISFRLTL